MVEVKSEIVSGVIELWGHRLDVQGELGTQEMLATLVLPIGDLGAGDDMMSNMGRPGVSDFLKDRFNRSEIHTRVAFNVSIEEVLDTVKELWIVVGDSERWFDSIVEQPSCLVCGV